MKGLLYLLAIYLSSYPLQAIYLFQIIENFWRSDLIYILVEDNSLIALLGIILAGTLLLFVDHFQNDTISLPKAIFFTLVLTSAAIITFFFLITDSTQLTQTVQLFPSMHLAIDGFLSFIYDYIPILFFLYVIYTTLTNIQTIKQYAFDEAQKKQLSLMQASIVTYLLLVPLTEIILTTFNLKNNSITIFIFGNILPDIFLLLGTILLWYAYVYTSRTAFLQAQRINQLIVIAKTGLPLYTYDFKQLDDSTPDSALVSGGLTAIESLLKEVVGTTSKINAIKFQKKAIMISIRQGFGVFLIADRTSKFLQQALERFADAFIKHYDLENPQKLEDFSGEISVFESADTIVERIFGLTETP